MKEKLLEIKEKLTLISYYEKNSVFYTKKHQSSSLLMKNLVEIITTLDNYKINYSIDENYNISLLKN